MSYSAVCDGNWWVGRVEGRGRYSALCDGDCWVGRVDGRGGPIDSFSGSACCCRQACFYRKQPRHLQLNKVRLSWIKVVKVNNNA